MPLFIHVFPGFFNAPYLYLSLLPWNSLSFSLARFGNSQGIAVQEIRPRSRVSPSEEPRVLFANQRGIAAEPGAGYFVMLTSDERHAARILRASGKRRNTRAGVRPPRACHETRRTDWLLHLTCTYLHLALFRKYFFPRCRNANRSLSLSLSMRELRQASARSVQVRSFPAKRCAPDARIDLQLTISPNSR